MRPLSTSCFRLQKARQGAAVVGNEERQTGAVERLDHLPALCRTARHRLFDIGRLSRSANLQSIFEVRARRRRDIDRVDIGTVNYLLRAIGPERNAVPVRIVLRLVAAATHDGDEPAVLHLLEAGPLFTSVTSPQPIMPQRISMITPFRATPPCSRARAIAAIHRE